MREDIVEAFHRVANLDRTQVFPIANRAPITNAEDAQTAAPGWVGDAWAGELLLVGNFPGGGGDAYIGNPTDRALYSAFRTFRDTSPGAPRLTAFSEMSRVYRQAERTHNLWRTLIRQVLDAIGVDESRTAFVNLVPFRIRENKAPTVSERRAAWNAGVAAQLDALGAQRIVALGTATGEALIRLNGFDSRVEVIPRTNGDRYLAPAALQALDRLRSEGCELE